MPTREEALAELYRRGALSEDQKAAYEELMRRGQIKGGSFENEFSSGPYLSDEEKKMGDEDRSKTSGLIDFFTGRDRQTDYTKKLPEFRQTKEIQDFAPRGSLMDQLKMTAGIMATFDPNAQMDIIKKYIPEASFFQDEKKNIIIDINGNQSVLNKPGFSSQDAINTFTTLLLNLPASKAANLSKSVLGKTLYAGGASALTEQGTQEAVKMLGSEQDRSPLATAMSFALGGIPELVGGAYKAFKGSQAIKEAGATESTLKEAIPQVKKADEASNQTGIRLFKGQKTLIPPHIQEQKFLSSLPEAQQSAYKQLRAQNREALTAVRDVMDRIATPEAVIEGPINFREAARKAVEEATDKRTKAASKYYLKAFEDTNPVDTSSVQNFITKKMNQFHSKSDVYKELSKIKTIVSPESTIEGEAAKALTLEKLQNTKFYLDKILDGSMVTSFDKQEMRVVGDIKKALVSLMESKSPYYKQGNKIFSILSGGVKKIEDSLVGQASRIEDSTLKDLSGKIFNPENNIQVISSAKNLITSKDPKAWNQLLRAEIEKRLGRVQTDMAEGVVGVENIPAQMYRSIFGNQKQRSILYKAADRDTAQSLYWLETALKRAQLGRDIGSETGIRSEITKKYNQNIWSVLWDTISHPVASITGGVGSLGRDAIREQKVKAAAAIFFDPKYKLEIKKIRGINPNSTKAINMMTRLMNRAISDQGGEPNESN